MAPTFSQRAATAKNAAAAFLFRLMEEKRTNLCLSADFTTCAELLQVATTLGPHICMLKTHVDILDDYTPDFPAKLQQAAAEHRFVILEDRKFADIGSTAAKQYSGGIHRIADWAHLVTVHALPGPGLVDGLASAVSQEEGAPPRGGLLLAQMSSQGSLADGPYAAKARDIAAARAGFVGGFISQNRAMTDAGDGFVYCTPGVQFSPEGKGDGLGQQYSDPTTVVLERGSDVIIVGRGIIAAKDPVAEARRYRDAAWAALEKRASSS